MTNRTTRRVGIALLVASIGALAFSTISLARVLADRNVHTVRLVGKVFSEETEINGELLTVERVPPLAAPGQPMPPIARGASKPFLRLTWRGRGRRRVSGRGRRGATPEAQRRATGCG